MIARSTDVLCASLNNRMLEKFVIDTGRRHSAGGHVTRIVPGNMIARKIKEVRLRGGCERIARSCSTDLGTAHEYLQRADAAGISWPLGEDWDEDRLAAALFGGPSRPPPGGVADARLRRPGLKNCL
jgi:hypothetical protein